MNTDDKVIQKKDVQALPSSDTSSNNSSTNIISQNSFKRQGRKTKKADKSSSLSIRKSVYSVAVKFYDEQISTDVWKLKDAIENIDKSVYQLLMMCHYKDEVSDGVWEVASEKRHYHLICRCVDRKKRFVIKTLLDKLGIVFRQGLDDNLLENRGLEIVGNYANYANYLTHQTEQAVKDGKAPYDKSEFISNMNSDEISQILDGYMNVSLTNKITTKDLVELDDIAFRLGYELKDFDNWYDSLQFITRSNAKMKTIRESYHRGIAKNISENTEINRVCIYVEGDANTGKTYACKQALRGNKILSVGGGGTGKFDKLTSATDAIIIDDDVCPNLLNMCDNYICFAYRRGSNNPVWAGAYFIVTSNLTFEDWVSKCGIKVYERQTSKAFGGCVYSKHFSAIYSRFTICKLIESNGINHLGLKHISERGTQTEQLNRFDKIMKFKDEFDKTIATYTKLDTVDFSQYLE